MEEFANDDVLNIKMIECNDDDADAIQSINDVVLHQLGIQHNTKKEDDI